MISVTITGGARISAALANGPQAVSAANRALYAGANDVFNESQRRTPVDTGALRGSGNLEQGDGTAEIRYGNTAASYAIYVHEGTSRMEARKFLEGPMVELADSVIARIKAAVDGAL